MSTQDQPRGDGEREGPTRNTCDHQEGPSGSLQGWSPGWQGAAGIGCLSPLPGCHPLSYHPPRYSGVPQGSLMSPFSNLARWKSLMTILEFFRRL